MQTVRVLLLPFQSGFLLFLFLLWLLWLGLPVLFLILEEYFQFFSVEDTVCCGLFMYDFYYVQICSFYASFLESFYHKCVFNFVKSFFCIYWNNHMVFIFQFVNMVYHIDLWILHPWNKAHLIMMYDF